MGGSSVPRVSIIMSVFNGERYLRESLDSLLLQRYTDWEAVICDDGSTDRTGDILREYAEADSRFVLFRHWVRTGLAQALNEALSQSRGSLIARHDADDVAMPSRLERQVEYLDANRDVDFVGSSAILIDSDGNGWGHISPPPFPDARDLIRGNCFVHPSVMIRREALVRVNGYNPKLVRTQDYDLWFRLYAQGMRGANLPEPLLRYRWDRSSYSRKTFKQRLAECHIRWSGYNALGLPCYSRIWVLKPLIVGVLPTGALFKWHRLRFR